MFSYRIGKRPRTAKRRILSCATSLPPPALIAAIQRLRAEVNKDLPMLLPRMLCGLEPRDTTHAHDGPSAFSNRPTGGLLACTPWHPRRSHGRNRVRITVCHSDLTGPSQLDCLSASPPQSRLFWFAPLSDWNGGLARGESHAPEQRPKAGMCVQTLEPKLNHNVTKGRITQIVCLLDHAQGGFLISEPSTNHGEVNGRDTWCHPKPCSSH
jgi:hypothetical protein